MVEKTKAAFRAMRDECGLTQQDIADEFGVNKMTIKRWEKPGEAMPPDDVWEWMVKARDNLYAEAKHFVDEVTREHKGCDSIVVIYYRSQDEVDQRQLPVGLDRPVGYVNAITRETVRILRDRHIDVRYAYAPQLVRKE